VAIRFIDTNIFVYHLTQNHQEYSPRCTALMERIEAGDVEAVTAVTAVDEALRVLTKEFGHEREDAARAMSVLMSQPEININHRAEVLTAIDFWAFNGPLSFVDSYHLALTKALGMTEIYTFDRKMGRFPGVDRVDP
jgi:predicted nucleic acid-binding protein